MLMSAVREGRYIMTDEERREAVEACLDDLRNAESVRERMIAVRSLATLDALNAQRERNAIGERQDETSAVLALLRSQAAGNHRVQAKLAELAEVLLDAQVPPTDGPQPLPAPEGHRAAPAPG
jgi:hypothetical protein